MESIDALVRRYYDQNLNDEWERLDRHRTEFYVTMRVLQDFLPNPPADILDCGGGPGRYAIELAKQGYSVTLFDLSEGNLKFAKEKADELGVKLENYLQGNAIDLGRFPDNSFDAVLMMGPLYYIMDGAYRIQAIREAKRVLKPGGVLFAAFINRYAVHRWTAKNEPEKIINNPRINDALIRAGGLEPGENAENEFCGYLAKSEQVDDLFWTAGMEVENVYGVEGLISLIDDNLNQMGGDVWSEWANLNYRISTDPAIRACVEHLLVVSKKPAWQEVLRNIVLKMEAKGLDYHIVGGASVALQGVRVKVKDIDIEMDKESAFRFQSIFIDHIKESVRYCQDERYSSYLGTFDFSGVCVEVCGDIRRNEAGSWTDTSVKTSRFVNLDDIPVRVSWIEEETLAYIRRGRMVRATLCLERSDRERVLSLLRGEVEVGVL
jgi:ubiquinone/menaquinone biosynthesis C-methylase UbiE